MVTVAGQLYWYHAECADQRPHYKHWVSLHCLRQLGQTPPVSKVFQAWPQVHDHTCRLRGTQPHRGQRMRRPVGGASSYCFSASTSGVMLLIAGTSL
jgi:hypothetical protein